MQSLTGILDIFKKTYESGVIEDITKFLHFIWDYMEKNYRQDSSDETPSVISDFFHRMEIGSPPRIALVGMTSAGKSSLVNALFGSSISEVKRTADTTDCVIKAEFPSGLLIFDTPGLAGDEELGYENITRLFLNLEQEEDSPIASTVRFQKEAFEDFELLSPEQLKQLPSLDAVLFLTDISRTLNKYEKKALKSLFFELKDKYKGRVVVGGTHLDELNKLSEEEKKGQLDSYRKIFSDNLTPVSSISGEGLSELVMNLFHVMPQTVPAARIQESLIFSKRLNRLTFTITESSNLLAEIILLKGNQGNEIRTGYLWLFALICKHYSVDEETWKKLNGDAIKISRRAKEAGTKAYKTVRKPKDFWEILRSFLGHRFEQDVVEHERIGVKGLKEILPGIYRLLYELSDTSGSQVSESKIHEIVDAKAHKLQPLIEPNKLTELAVEIGEILQSLFPDS